MFTKKNRNLITNNEVVFNGFMLQTYLKMVVFVRKQTQPIAPDNK
jgi:hypothetical protein